MHDHTSKLIFSSQVIKEYNANWYNTTPCLNKKRATFISWITPWNIGQFCKFLAGNIKKKPNVNDYSLAL